MAAEGARYSPVPRRALPVRPKQPAQPGGHERRIHHVDRFGKWWKGSGEYPHAEGTRLQPQLHRASVEPLSRRRLSRSGELIGDFS